MRPRYRHYLLQIILLVWWALTLTGCNKTSSTSDASCSDSLIAAQTYLSSYYATSEKQSLHSSLRALKHIDAHCPDFAKRTVELHVMVFTLLEQHAEGAAYIQRLDTADFSRPYQKSMHYNLFRARLAKQQGDTTAHATMIARDIQNIENFITQHKADEQAIYELYLLKLQAHPLVQVLNELETKRGSYQVSDEFIEGMQGTLEGLENTLFAKKSARSHTTPANHLINSVENASHRLELHTEILHDTLSGKWEDDLYGTPIVKRQYLKFYKGENLVKYYHLPIINREKSARRSGAINVPFYPVHQICVLKGTGGNFIYSVYGADFCNGVKCPEFFGYYGPMGEILYEGFSTEKPQIENFPLEKINKEFDERDPNRSQCEVLSIWPGSK